MMMAEREGFEPSVQENLYAGFRIRCIRPLCHLSCAVGLSWKFYQRVGVAQGLSVAGAGGDASTLGAAGETSLALRGARVKTTIAEPPPMTLPS